jgi:hypothetical protein
MSISQSIDHGMSVLIHILVIAYSSQWISQWHWPLISRSWLHFVCGAAWSICCNIKVHHKIHDILNSAFCVRDRHCEMCYLLSVCLSLAHMHTYTFVQTTVRIWVLPSSRPVNSRPAKRPGCVTTPMLSCVPLLCPVIRGTCGPVKNQNVWTRP